MMGTDEVVWERNEILIPVSAEMAEEVRQWQTFMAPIQADFAQELSDYMEHGPRLGPPLPAHILEEQERQRRDARRRDQAAWLLRQLSRSGHPGRLAYRRPRP